MANLLESSLSLIGNLMNDSFYQLTNKEASTVLFSVVKHASSWGSGRAREKCRGKHETQSSVFPTIERSFQCWSLRGLCPFGCYHGSLLLLGACMWLFWLLCLMKFTASMERGPLHSAISGSSGTFPRKFPHHLSPFRKFRNFGSNGKCPW